MTMTAPTVRYSAAGSASVVYYAGYARAPVSLPYTSHRKITWANWNFRFRSPASSVMASSPIS